MKTAREEATVRRRAFLEPHRAVLTRFGAKLAPAKSGGQGIAQENETMMPPSQIKIEMRDYQVRGLRWLASMHANGCNAILADEMGLGKTLQTIAFLAHLKFDLGVPGPHLVVAPLSVLSSWMTEIKRFCPELRAVKLHSSDVEERKRLITSLSEGDDYDVVVTTYEMAKSPNVTGMLAYRTWWRYLVVDEGHILKNDMSQVSQALRKFHFAHALLLTGTPLQNNLHELWALLNFLYPELFPQSAAFDDAFNLNSGAKGITCDNAQLAAAGHLLRPFMIRRTKNEVEKRMPPKLETTITCPLSDMQLFWYKRLLLRESSLLKQLETDNIEAASTGTDWKKLASLLMQLRKCCNHPFLFPGVEPSADEAYSEQLIDGSGKFQLLERLLAKLFSGGHRVVLFSQFTSTLDLLEDFLTHKEYKYCRLDGSTNRVQRTVDINSFNMPGSSRFVFLMSTRAGGLGINCQTADTCILFDSDWNPQIDLQAMARVHRIGQTKVVHLYRLVTSGTVEERIVQRAEKKLYLDKMVDGSHKGAEAGGSSGKDEELSSSEMKSMLKFGAQCCFQSAEPPSDAMIDTIIDRTRKEGDSLGEAFSSTSKSAADFDATTQMLNMRELQGESFGEKKEKDKSAVRDLEGMLSGGGGASTLADIDEQWRAVQQNKRQHKSRMSTVHVVGVGKVQVLNENDYEMGENMPNAATHGGDTTHKNGRQVAGRDFLHEERCLSCWQGPEGAKKKQKAKAKAKATPAKASPAKARDHLGGDGGLRGCDYCPAAFHLSCIGMSEADSNSFGGWACPHHSCATCGRKAAAAGGLLFRCAVCPHSFCEDHLPPEALIMGENKRFQDLGHIHPKQGCYLLCSAACVALSAQLGFDCGEAAASAAAILGATGVDTTLRKGKGKAKITPAKVQADTRTEWDKLQPGVAKALLTLLGTQPGKLYEASAGFTKRAGDVGTSMSLLELLTDLVFDADSLSQAAAGDRKKQDAEQIKSKRAAARTTATERVAAWQGAAPERDIAKLTAEDKEAAAEVYLRLVRQLEGTRGETLQGLAKLLRVQRLSLTGGGGQNPAKLKLADTAVSVGRKVMAPVLALFLTLPDKHSLVIDERAGSSKQSDKTAKEMQGDPGFLVNGPPLTESTAHGGIRRMELKSGTIVEVAIPRPVFKQYIPPPAPKLSPLELAQHQLTLPEGWEVRIARSSGEVYYYQPSSAKSQWDKPVGPASNEAPKFNVGDVVVIDGLVSKPELNGCQARVISATTAPQGFDVARGRHHVELLMDGTQLTVKPSNMQLAAPLGRFNAGDVVIIEGLKAKPELNGCKARVGTFDVATGRHHVVLEDGTALSIKPSNAQLAVPLGQPAP